MGFCRFFPRVHSVMLLCVFAIVIFITLGPLPPSCGFAVRRFFVSELVAMARRDLLLLLHGLTSRIHGKLCSRKFRFTRPFSRFNYRFLQKGCVIKSFVVL